MGSARKEQRVAGTTSLVSRNGFTGGATSLADKENLGVSVAFDYSSVAGFAGVDVISGHAGPCQDRLSYVPATGHSSLAAVPLRNPFHVSENSPFPGHAAVILNSTGPSPSRVPLSAQDKPLQSGLMAKRMSLLTADTDTTLSISNRVSLLSSTTNAIQDGSRGVLSGDCIVFPAGLVNFDRQSSLRTIRSSKVVQADGISACSEVSDKTLVDVPACFPTAIPPAHPCSDTPATDRPPSMMCSLNSDDSGIASFVASDSLRIGSPQLLSRPVTDFHFLSAESSPLLHSSSQSRTLVASSDGRASSASSTVYSPGIRKTKHNSDSSRSSSKFSRQAPFVRESKRSSLRSWFDSHLPFSAPSSSEESSDCRASYRYYPKAENRAAANNSGVSLGAKSSSSNSSWYHRSILAQLAKPKSKVHVSAMRPTSHAKPESAQPRSPQLLDVRLENYDRSPRRLGSFMSCLPCATSSSSKSARRLDFCQEGKESCSEVPDKPLGDVEEAAAVSKMPDDDGDDDATCVSTSAQALSDITIIECSFNVNDLAVALDVLPMADHSLPGSEGGNRVEKVSIPISPSESGFLVPTMSIVANSLPLAICAFTPPGSLVPRCVPLDFVEGVNTTDYHASRSSLSSSSASSLPTAIGATSCRRQALSSGSQSPTSFTSALSTDDQSSAWTRAYQRRRNRRWGHQRSFATLKRHHGPKQQHNHHHQQQQEEEEQAEDWEEPQPPCLEVPTRC